MSVAIGQILLLLLDIAFWIIIAQVIVSWLIVFGVINMRNPNAAKIVFFMEKITDPVYRPLRKLIPPIAGIDLTPILLIIAIEILKRLVFGIFFY